MRALPLALLALATSTSACGADDPTFDCPSGASAYRRTIAEDTETWCRRSDGVAHGLYEHTVGPTTVAEGGFAQGLPDGVWRRYDAEGELIAVEGYAAGQPHGQWLGYSDALPSFEHHWAYGIPCGAWIEFEDGAEISRQDLGDCATIAEPEPAVGPPLAPNDDFGWDGGVCPSGRLLVVAPADDPDARYCTDASGQLDGPFGRWHDAYPGPKAAGGEYREGARSGLWRFTYPSGSARAEGVFDGDSETGVWRFWGADRALSEEGAFVDAARDGAWKRYWPHGVTAATGSYVDGLQSGAWQTFYPTGVPDETQRWVAGLLDGPYVKNHPSGVHQEAGALVRGQRSGAWTFWYDNGVEGAAGSYQAGLPIGPWSSWDRAGLLSTLGSYDDGVQDGTWSVWSWQEGERVKATGRVDAGINRGEWILVYDPGGEPAGRFNYVDGQREGLATNLWRNGTVQSDGVYLNGQPHGLWTYNYQSGALFFDVELFKGRRHGSYRAFYADGDPQALGQYREDRKVETWTYWDEDGIARTESYDAWGNPQ